MNQRPPRENRNAHRKNHQEEEEEECPRVSLPPCPAADDAGEDARRPLPALLVPSLWLYVLVLLAALAMPCRALCPNNCTCDDKVGYRWCLGVASCSSTGVFVCAVCFITCHQCCFVAHIIIYCVCSIEMSFFLQMRSICGIIYAPRAFL